MTKYVQPGQRSGPAQQPERTPRPGDVVTDIAASLTRFRTQSEGVADPDYSPLWAVVALWSLTVPVLSVLLSRWMSWPVVALWVGAHTIVYFASDRCFRYRSMSRQRRILRTVLSAMIWASIPVSLLISGSYPEHEWTAVFLVTIFGALRSVVLPDEARAPFEVDGPFVVLAAGMCSLLAGSTPVALGLFLVGVFFAGAEHFQADLHRVAQEDRDRLRSALQKMEDLAKTDQLTGLPNRRGAVELLDVHASGPFVVALFDIDDFKTINDRYGYVAGDRAIAVVANTISERLGGPWHVCRVGGDEFIALGAGDAPIADGAFDPIELEVTSFDGTTTSLAVAVSAGLDRFDGVADLSAVTEQLVPRLRKAKRTKGLRVEGSATSDWQRSVVAALERREFEWFGQTVVDLTTGEATGVELLCRWPQADGTMVSPADFLPVLSTDERSQKLAFQVIENACTWFSAIDRLSTTNLLTVNVNVLPRNLNEALVDFIDQTLTPDQAQRLHVEVVEDELIGTSPAVSKAIQKLRGLGVKTYLDDFGAGYSNFFELGLDAFDGVKLDRSLLVDHAENPSRLPILQHLQSLADELDVDFVVEGVEGSVDHDLLLRAGVRSVQGFHYSRPIPLDSFLATLSPNM